MPGMLFDVSEIDEVQQRTDRRVDEVVELPAFLVCKSPGLDKLRRAFEVLLKKHRRLDAARPPLKDGGPIFQVRHDVVRDLEIETEQIKLCKLFVGRSEEHTSELQSQSNLVCRLLLEKKKKINNILS